MGNKTGTPPELTALLREIAHQGWVCERTPGGHIKAIPPDRSKPIVFLSNSPSDRFALVKIRRDLRRSGANI